MKYPVLYIDRQKLLVNAKNVLIQMKNYHMQTMAVIKGVNGLEEITRILINAGFELLASSRLSQLKKVKEINPSIKTCALRVPMISEVDELVRYVDISLNSSKEVLVELNNAAEKQHKIHEIILMVDLGDLREGIYADEELISIAKLVEYDLNSLYLLGIGVNLGCYGSIIPTVQKMNELCAKANMVSHAIGRELEIVSGGATTSFPLVAKGVMLSGINQLRIGDGLFVSDLDDCFCYKMFEKEREAFTLRAEIIEIRDKPSHPIGEIGVDAFGDKKVYIDKGIHKRALIAVGRQDLGDCHHLKPLDNELEVIGGSSDHTILDISKCTKEYKVGDIVEFHIMYENLFMLCQSTYVEKVYIGG